VLISTPLADMMALDRTQGAMGAAVMDSRSVLPGLGWAVAGGPWLFVPAGVGLGVQLATVPDWPSRLLAASLLLLLLEQAHMAQVDLQHTAAVAARTADRRLHRFYGVLLATLAAEVAGFSVAATGALGLGGALVVLALVGFNLGAGVELRPQDHPPLQPATAQQRLGVLGADGLALGLLGLWGMGVGRLWIGAGLLGLLVVYAGIKLSQGYLRDPDC